MMERTEGFLQINEYETIRKCDIYTDGANCILWFRWLEKEYLFKCGTYDESYSEVFWGYVLDHLKLENVHYDLAKLNGFYGVITENCNYQKRPAVDLRGLLRNYYKKNKLGNMQEQNDNLTFTKEAYDDIFKRNYSPEAIASLKDQTYLHFIIQILLGNSDLNRKNMKIYLDTLTLFPFYDFGRYGRVSLRWLENREFIYGYSRKKILEDSRTTFQNFLNFATKEELEKYKEYMYFILDLKTKEIFEEMENNINSKINWNLKRTLTKQLKRNAIKSEKIIRKNQR